MLSTPRPPLESAPGPWRLHSHKTTLISLLIATSESQESCTEWRARRAAQCLWSGVHLGTGQVGWTNTNTVHDGDPSCVFMFSLCWSPPPPVMVSWVMEASPPRRSPGLWRPSGGCPWAAWQQEAGTLSALAASDFHTRQDTGNWVVACCLQEDEGEITQTVWSPDGGDLYVWGWNESGQLGLPSRALRKTLEQQQSTQAGR